jgi:tRNA-splicing ligase RtcB
MGKGTDTGSRVRTERLDPWRLRVPRHGQMRVDGIVYASEESAAGSLDDGSLSQVANVAALPGIVGPALAMPDVHQGYGFPIGGVAAFDEDEGVVSPGGVGYDINCGVRLYRTDLEPAQLGEGEPERNRLLAAIAREVPTGVGQGHRREGLSERELEAVLADGARWVVRQGLGEHPELERIEEGGALRADPDAVSRRARQRGQGQLGSLGSGNHFVELGRVDTIYDAEAAAAFGLAEGAVTVMVHTGSRGLGHQVCDDWLRTLSQAAAKHGIALPDRQLACAPVSSPEGRRYLAAMSAAANFAFANRQVIGHRVREALEQALHLGPRELGMRLVYDVCHNIAKLEKHRVDGTDRRLCVHRKGATRALPPGHPLLPAVYRDSGQPVLVPGDLGRSSYVLAGRAGAAETHFSACHGAGRVMSRKAALRAAKGRLVVQELKETGLALHAARHRTLIEEMPEAYRDVSDVVAVVQGAALADPVARLVPLAVLKG